MRKYITTYGWSRRDPTMFVGSKLCLVPTDEYIERQRMGVNSMYHDNYPYQPTDAELAELTRRRRPGMMNPANWLYLIGSVCFILGTLYNMLTTR